ncbi:MAG: hypothetical protein DMF59_09615 [Acidobacteria bacterium]|nr:MAG: hypothetical protein DMF59_09615 [Acidobacteriota bacterium]
MNSPQPVTVAQYGIGPIGAEIARLLLTKSWVKLVAAVDIDTNKVGKDLGDVIGLGRKVGVAVTLIPQVRDCAKSRRSSRVCSNAAATSFRRAKSCRFRSITRSATSCSKSPARTTSRSSAPASIPAS